MARSRRQKPKEPGDRGQADLDDRRTGVESLFQEFVRRTATLGLSGFFLTEEALRRAFGDVVPKEWVKYAAKQSAEMRSEVLDRVSAEFGQWLRSLDAEELQRSVLRTLLEHYDLQIQLEISARPRSGERSSLELVPRRK